MQGVFLFLHILGAAIWTGGHIVLSIAILPKALREKSPAILIGFESVYEKIGMPSLILQIATGLYLAFQFIPRFGGWFDFSNPVAHPIMLKLGLLALTFVFALHARLRVIPNLTPDKLVLMAWHIVPVTLISILFVFAGVSFRTGWLY